MITKCFLHYFYIHYLQKYEIGMERTSDLYSQKVSRFILMIQVSEVLKCVLAQNGGRFVWKRNAFCSKMEDVLYQNAFRFAIKRRRKMENAYAQYALHLYDLTSLKP